MRSAIVLSFLFAIAYSQQGPVLILNQCSTGLAAYQVFVSGFCSQIHATLQILAALTPLFPLLSLKTYNNTGTKKNIYTTSSFTSGSPMCIDIADFNTGVNATVYTWPCGQGGASTNEAWSVTTNSIQSQDANPGMCLVVGNPGDPPASFGSVITTAVCDSNSTSQTLHFDSATGRIIHTPTGLCVDAGTQPPPFCQISNHATWTVCDPSATLADRAADLVSRLSIADKLSSLITHTPALSSIGLPAYDWWSEATHGISRLPGGDRTASNTALPITTSCSFNRSLWRATGNVIGREARAYINAGEAYGTYWAPGE